MGELKPAAAVELQQPELSFSEPGVLLGAAVHLHSHPKHHQLSPERPCSSAAELFLVWIKVLFNWIHLFLLLLLIFFLLKVCFGEQDLDHPAAKDCEPRV